jgi:hypothetical protein
LKSASDKNAAAQKNSHTDPKAGGRGQRGKGTREHPFFLGDMRELGYLLGNGRFVTFLRGNSDMKLIRCLCAVPFLAGIALAPCTQARAAGCAGAGSTPLTIGTVAPVAAGAPRNFTLSLGAHEGVIIDLANLAPRPAGDDNENHSGDSDAKPAPRGLRLCDGQGALLAPQPGEVFEKGGSLTATDDGERLRFQADAEGTYLIAVAPAEIAREILVRHRDVGISQPPIVSAALGTPQKGITSSLAPMVFSFAGTGGQWVDLKATSDKDTLLRLAGPDREGNYAVIAENDDSDGLNPRIRRKLPITGTYFVQVDSLADEPGEFDLTLARIDPPPPPPPPAPLRLGTRVTGRLADSDAVGMYVLPVAAGHSYRVDLTTAYDGVVAIGVSNPVEPDDGGSGPDAGFTEIKSQDANTSGTERLTFTARGNGQLLVRVKSFGIGDTDGGYTLTTTDLGG